MLNRIHLTIPGDENHTIACCASHWVRICQEAIRSQGRFSVALSGGSTPQKVYRRLTTPPYSTQIDWSKVHLFWSDERSVSPEDPQSNYHMAMSAGFSKMPIPTQQIHRMRAEDHIEQNALAYEQTLREVLGASPLDLILLGMGEDGHTASLFPGTEGLSVTNRWVIAHFVPQLTTWRMSFTFPCIHSAAHVAIYVLGASKQNILKEVLTTDRGYPIQRVGHKALWIVDAEAAALLPHSLLRAITACE